MSKFADFFNHATTEEREAVFAGVMDAASCRQLATQRGWKEVDRGGFAVWVAPNQPAWVVVYPKGPGNPNHDIYRAYKSLWQPKKGQMPWAVDNRSLSKDGFRSLAEAIAAAEAA